MDYALWVGIGYKEGTTQAMIARAVSQICWQYDLEPEAILGCATLDKKAQAPELRAYCLEKGWLLKTFPKEILHQVLVPNPTEIVRELVGCPSVAEAAAILAAQGKLVVPKQVIERKITLAIAAAQKHLY